MITDKNLEKIIYDLSLQDIDGLFSGNIYTTISKERKRQKKQEKRNDDHNHYINIAILEMYDELSESINSMQEQTDRIGDRFALLTNRANNTLIELELAKTEMSDLLNLQKDELAKLEAGLAKGNYHNGDRNEHLIQIELKKAEIANTSTILTLYDDTITSTRSTLGNASDKLTNARNRISYLNDQKENALNSSNPQEQLEALQKEIELAEKEITAAAENIELAERQARFSGESLAYARNNLQLSSINISNGKAQLPEINARTNIAKRLTAIASDGVITEKEFAKFKKLSLNANIDENDINKIAQDIGNSGVMIQLNNGTAYSGNDAAEYVIGNYDLGNIDAFNFLSLNPNSITFNSHAEKKTLLSGTAPAAIITLGFNNNSETKTTITVKPTEPFSKYVPENWGTGKSLTNSEFLGATSKYDGKDTKLQEPDEETVIMTAENELIH